jgi:hypothetical protein
LLGHEGEKGLHAILVTNPLERPDIDDRKGRPAYQRLADCRNCVGTQCHQLLEMLAVADLGRPHDLFD